MASGQIRGPKPYAVGGDFALWVRRFEAYSKAVRIPDEQMCNALLALLDDDAFRAFDLLQLSAAEVADYKRLVEALSLRFASTAGEAELRFQLSQRCQLPAETLDQFADALIDLTNRAYPALEQAVRAGLARDRFIAGVSADYIQESLLEKAPETLDKAREHAKRLEAARIARRRMQTGKATVHSVGNDAPSEEPRVAAATGARQDELTELVRRNTETMQELLRQMTAATGGVHQLQPKMFQNRQRQARARPQPTCWTCGERGHLRRNCPVGPNSGNEQRLATWVNRQPAKR